MVCFVIPLSNPAKNVGTLSFTWTRINAFGTLAGAVTPCGAVVGKSRKTLFPRAVPVREIVLVNPLRPA